MVEFQFMGLERINIVLYYGVHSGSNHLAFVMSVIENHVENGVFPNRSVNFFCAGSEEFRLQGSAHLRLTLHEPEQSV